MKHIKNFIRNLIDIIKGFIMTILLASIAVLVTLVVFIILPLILVVWSIVNWGSCCEDLIEYYDYIFDCIRDNI